MPSTGDIVRASDFQAIKPQLSIGTVTTGAAGSNASASISGTTPNFILNLTIPRGANGVTSWSTSVGSASSSRPSVVVTTYRSGNTWYRVYSDGFVEQGGRTGTSQTGRVTFPRRFSSVLLEVQITQQLNLTNWAEKWSPQIIGTPSTSSFAYCWGNGYVSGSWLFWYACGY